MTATGAPTSFDHDPWVLVGAEVAGARTDVRVERGQIAAVGPDLAGPGDRVVRAEGGALLPGLHDHHLHLLAMAAARASVDVTGVASPDAFDQAVRDAHARAMPGRWLRIVGVDEVHGPVDRARLDALVPDRPVRAQHRSGAAWALNGAGLAAVGAQGAGEDGWLHQRDDELRLRWDDGEAPDLAPVGAELARLGVTGATDATPYEDPTAWAVLAAATIDGSLPQRVVATGGPALAREAPPGALTVGPVKLLVADGALPSIEELALGYRVAHEAGRPVAVHCVTRLGLVLALAAWEDAGATTGDRIEHGSVIPAELVPRIAALGLAVVTQPAFLRSRGDAYLATVEPDDVGHLYRCGSLLAANVAVGLSTDAPFGPADPWLAIAAAADRRTRTGATVGAPEAIPAAEALARFLTAPDAPGGAPRRVVVGAPADLVLLDGPLDVALAAPSRAWVRSTWIGGRPVHAG